MSGLAIRLTSQWGVRDNTGLAPASAPASTPAPISAPFLAPTSILDSSSYESNHQTKSRQPIFLLCKLSS